MVGSKSFTGTEMRLIHQKEPIHMIRCRRKGKRRMLRVTYGSTFHLLVFLSKKTIFNLLKSNIRYVYDNTISAAKKDNFSCTFGFGKRACHWASQPFNHWTGKPRRTMLKNDANVLHTLWFLTLLTLSCMKRCSWQLYSAHVEFSNLAFVKLLFSFVSDLCWSAFVGFHL